MSVIGKSLETACELLSSGEVVAIPTETVYGLAGNALNTEAVDKIYSIKSRPRNNPLILHIPGIDRLQDYVKDVPDLALKLAEKFWPGPLTLLLPKANHVIGEVTAGLPNLAIRVPAHPLTLNLLNMLSFPLAAPSANPYGYISPTNPAHVNSQLGEKIKYILDGGSCIRGVESTIVGFEDNCPVIYRMGAVTPGDIKTITGNVRLYQKQENKPLTSGMSLSHYSPKTSVYLTKNINGLNNISPSQNLGLLTFKDFYPITERDKQVILSPAGDLDEAAKNLYEALHRLDSMQLDLIIAEYVPDEGIGTAINDRLTRAAHKVIS
jgi:L-threonylcarbamoyladenylate synthase